MASVWAGIAIFAAGVFVGTALSAGLFGRLLYAVMQAQRSHGES